MARPGLFAALVAGVLMLAAGARGQDPASAGGDDAALDALDRESARQKAVDGLKASDKSGDEAPIDAEAAGDALEPATRDAPVAAPEAVAPNAASAAPTAEAAAAPDTAVVMPNSTGVAPSGVAPNTANAEPSAVGAVPNAAAPSAAASSATAPSAAASGAAAPNAAAPSAAAPNAAAPSAAAPSAAASGAAAPNAAAPSAAAPNAAASNPAVPSAAAPSAAAPNDAASNPAVPSAAAPNAAAVPLDAVAASPAGASPQANAAAALPTAAAEANNAATPITPEQTAAVEADLRKTVKDIVLAFFAAVHTPAPGTVEVSATANLVNDAAGTATRLSGVAVDVHLVAEHPDSLIAEARNYTQRELDARGYRFGPAADAADLRIPATLTFKADMPPAPTTWLERRGLKPILVLGAIALAAIALLILSLAMLVRLVRGAPKTAAARAPTDPARGKAGPAVLAATGSQNVPVVDFGPRDEPARPGPSALAAANHAGGLAAAPKGVPELASLGKSARAAPPSPRDPAADLALLAAEEAALHAPKRPARAADTAALAAEATARAAQIAAAQRDADAARAAAVAREALAREAAAAQAAFAAREALAAKDAQTARDAHDLNSKWGRAASVARELLEQKAQRVASARDPESRGVRDPGVGAPPARGARESTDSLGAAPTRGARDLAVGTPPARGARESTDSLGAAPTRGARDLATGAPPARGARESTDSLGAAPTRGARDLATGAPPARGARESTDSLGAAPTRGARDLAAGTPPARGARESNAPAAPRSARDAVAEMLRAGAKKTPSFTLDPADSADDSLVDDATMFADSASAFAPPADDPHELLPETLDDARLAIYGEPSADRSGASIRDPDPLEKPASAPNEELTQVLARIEQMPLDQAMIVLASLSDAERDMLFDRMNINASVRRRVERELDELRRGPPEQV